MCCASIFDRRLTGLARLPERIHTPKLTSNLDTHIHNRRLLRRPWRVLLGLFAAREWSKIPLGTLLGALLAATRRLVISDEVFHAFVSQHWQTFAIKDAFTGIGAYRAEIYAIGIGLVVLALTQYVPALVKVLRSWTEGVVSGLTVIWGSSFFYYFGSGQPDTIRNLICFLSLAFPLTLLSIAFHLRAASRRAEPVTLPPPAPVVRPTLDGYFADLEADSPIERASQDLLGRSDVVDWLATSLVELGAPVIALDGDYGDGKSSVLNLVRERLDGRAIVVSFKTWLPNSEATLVRDLFNDISAECRGFYHVPQLRNHLLGYAKIIGASISPLKGLSDVFPPSSQRAEIAELAESLRLIPLRVVVLLDEMDRLQPDEFRILLKVVRGVTSFTNLSFVCAFSRKAVEKMFPPGTVENVNDYYEKFFPVSYLLPKPDSGFLFAALETRLKKVFSRADWFETADDETKYHELLTGAWDDALSKVLTNLRKIAILANSLSVVARPLSREANAFDMVIIETLRCFFPEVYERVRQNGDAFLGSDPSWRSRFYSEDQAKASRKQFYEHLIQELYATERSKPAADLLWWLFPEFAMYLSTRVGRSLVGIEKDSDLAERQKRISHDDFFPIYFGYRVPETLYSGTELRAFVRNLNESGSTAERKVLFQKTLRSITEGDPRRLSFLHRILHSIGRFDDSTARALAIAVSECASDYSYDSILPSAAEAGKAMAIIFEVAQRFSQSAEVQKVLEDSILAATDDTLAFRLLTFCLAPERNKILKDFSHVRADALKKTFAQRMRRRYVERFEDLDTSLAQCDRSAFVLWAESSSEDREAEVGFWRRYVDSSRKRLAKMCDILFPSGTLWESDPSPHIDRLFPLSELEMLNDGLPNDPMLEEVENRALNRMRKLIGGGFQHGVRFEDLANL